MSNYRNSIFSIHADFFKLFSFFTLSLYMEFFVILNSYPVMLTFVEVICAVVFLMVLATDSVALSTGNEMLFFRPYFFFN